MRQSSHQIVGDHPLNVQERRFLPGGWQEHTFLQQVNENYGQLRNSDKADRIVDEYLILKGIKIVFLQHLLPVWPHRHSWLEGFRNSKTVPTGLNYQVV